MNVKSVEYAGKADVYNMVVDDTHDFVVQGGVVTHNCDSLRYICMGNIIAPRIIEPKVSHMHDPLNQFKEAKKYDKYNALR